MSKIEATIIKHSKCPRGHELVTYELVFPRFLLAELNTHRMFSKNSASSRAIPFKKMVQMVSDNPFIPIAFQKEHKGMQGSEYLTGIEAEVAEKNWIVASEKAVMMATHMNEGQVTKQLCNRLLEPFMWHKVVLTTGLEGLRNFFELRCPEYVIGLTPYKSKKECVNAQRTIQEPSPECLGFTELDWLLLNKGQAEIHMMELAEQMYDAYNESVPQNLKEGEWHVPYEELLTDSQVLCYLQSDGDGPWGNSDYTDIKIKASTGMLARASYITIGDDKVPSIETLIGIHDKMVNSKPFHASPFEHCSQVPTQDEYEMNYKGTSTYLKASGGIFPHEAYGWFRNFRGFKQYRMILEQVHQA